MEELVEISKARYDELLDIEQKMCAFEAAGVDNWQGIDMVYEILDEWNEEG